MSGASSLNHSNNSDWSQYSPITYNNNVSTSTSWTSIYSVNGKGYVSKAMGVTSSSIAVNFRVTIDGSIVYLAQTQSSYCCGIVKKTHALIYNNQLQIPIYGGLSYSYSNSALDYFTNYPYTGGAIGMFTLLPQEIFFNSSFKIEVMSTNTSNTNIDILGGVK